MGIFDRFRPADESRGRTYQGQQTRLSEDEQALARYRYMLKTAPPETKERYATMSDRLHMIGRLGTLQEVADAVLFMLSRPRNVTVRDLVILPNSVDL